MLRTGRSLVLAAFLAACAGSEGDPSSGNGGRAGSGGASSSAGASVSSGGATLVSGGASLGGNGAAGSANNGGSVSGGVAAGGSAANTGGSSSGGASSAVGGQSAAGSGGNSSNGGSAVSAGGNSNGGAANGGNSSGGTINGGTSNGGAAGKGGTAGTAGMGTSGGGGGSTVFKPPFILGADVTITVEDEYWGANYTDNGQLKSLEQILKDHGFNFIRVDTFIDPGKTGGYSATMPEAFRDLAHTIKLGQRVKRIGMGFLLDLHYSQTWTNPGAQATPSAWSGQNIDALEKSVYDYTKDALAQLKAASAQPDMVQIGNEITNGMLWETGRNSTNFVNFARLLKAGIRAVRETNPDIQVMLHIEKCNNTETTRWWLDGVLAQSVSFDILGQSCYAPTRNSDGSIKHPGYQGEPSAWAATFATLVSAYPNLKFAIAEYSSEQRAANDVMFQLPNHRGVGTFNWDPTRAYDTHPNVPLFSTNGAWNRYVAIPQSMALYEQMAEDYGLR